MKFSDVAGKSLICVEDQEMHTFGKSPEDGFIITKLTIKDVYIALRHMQLAAEDTKLRRKPQTPDEIEYKKCYHYLDNLERKAMKELQALKV